MYDKEPEAHTEMHGMQAGAATLSYGMHGSQSPHMRILLAPGNTSTEKEVESHSKRKEMN